MASLQPAANGLCVTKLRAMLATAWLALLVGCASAPSWPPVTGSTTVPASPGRWIWAELFTADAAAARQFYGHVFGWEFETRGAGDRPYTLVTNAGQPVAGMLNHPASADAAQRARWVGLMSVADVDGVARRARAAGGTMVIEPLDLRGRGRVALVSDPEGARFGLLNADGGDPPDVMPEAGDWLWHELWAHSADAMSRFYATMAPYQIEEAGEVAGRPELHLQVGGYPRAGIIEHGESGPPSTWLHYVRVADLNVTLARVEQAGGRILIAPAPTIRQGRIAIIADPLGAALGVAEWSETALKGDAS